MVIYKKILLNLLKSLIIAGVLTVIINYYYDLKLSISNPHFYFLFFGSLSLLALLLLFSVYSYLLFLKIFFNKF